MARYAVLNADRTVVNIIEWDGSADWAPPEGHSVILADDETRLRDKFDGKTFVHPPPPQEPEPQKTETDHLVDLLESKGVLTKKQADDWRAQARESRKK